MGSLSKLLKRVPLAGNKRQKTLNPGPVSIRGGKVLPGPLFEWRRKTSAWHLF
jgi:hypothetical protein